VSPVDIMTNTEKYGPCKVTDNIVKDKKRFNRFKKMLEEECSRLEKTKSFSEQKHLSQIIDEIKCLKSYFQMRLERDLDVSKQENNTNLQSLYDKYFDSYTSKKELLEDLKKESDNFFFNRKMSQLCHSYGVFQEHINENNKVSIECKNYFRFLLFQDYFETFPKLLRPVLKRVWTERNKHRWIEPFSTREFYNLFSWIVSDETINHENIKNMYSKLRNDIAHTTVLLGESDLQLHERGRFNKKREEIKGMGLEDIMKQIDVFEMVAIIYSTELDFRLLNLGLKKDDSYFKEWKEFFKNYRSEWQKIGAITRNDDKMSMAA